MGNQSWANVWKRQTKVNENLYRFFEGVGSHCVAINKNVYESCITMLLNESLPVDILYWKLYEKHNCYCPTEFLADSLSKNCHLGRNDRYTVFDSLINHKYYEDTVKNT